MKIHQNPLTPELNVTDLEKSLYFYVDILGFIIEYKREEEGFALISINNAQLMLDQINKGRTWKTGNFEYPLGRGVNFEIKVKDVDELFKKVKENNIPLYMDMEEKWYRRTDHEVGNKQFLIQDPDGYLLRFIKDLGSRPLK
jgi:catechol 2,3-dioxygenase-like lactoylglutathione lyase family enzyme